MSRVFFSYMDPDGFIPIGLQHVNFRPKSIFVGLAPDLMQHTKPPEYKVIATTLHGVREDLRVECHVSRNPAHDFQYLSIRSGALQTKKWGAPLGGQWGGGGQLNFRGRGLPDPPLLTVNTFFCSISHR